MRIGLSSEVEGEYFDKIDFIPCVNVTSPLFKRSQIEGEPNGLYYDMLLEIAKGDSDATMADYLCPESGNMKINGQLGSNFWLAPKEPTLNTTVNEEGVM